MKQKTRRGKGLGVLLGILLFSMFASAQSVRTVPDDWQLLDPQKDSVYGVSMRKAYEELLPGKKPHQVIVAVIDSGVDTAQADLQGRIWTNPGEIAGNGVDDDKNGYVDDIHGWNFLGGKDGRSVNKESSELEREYSRLEARFQEVTDSADVKKKDRSDYRYWLTLQKKRHQDSVDNAQNYATVHKGLGRFLVLEQILQQHMNKDTLFLGDIAALDPQGNDTLAVAKEIVTRILENTGPHSSLESFLAEGKDYMEGLKQKLTEMNTNPNALRAEIVGDDPNNIDDKDYGNNNVTGNFARHATHVAGIIAADQDNQIGMDGIANDVLIMPVKVVPNGDERDKDVALGIRYAVDNGAQIINMSFGKGYSPHKQWVDEAVRYAQKHDVLLIHAAGNDGADNDSVDNYPNPIYLKSGKRAENFITVGASSPTNEEGHLAASFSNYGAKGVDLFAPGVNIFSTVPGNQYEYLSGTSMATPVVTGVAALLLEYYPQLSARQIREILNKSVTRLDSVRVIKPGTNQEVPFSSLSISGGIINAYNALKMAASVKGEREKK